MHESTVIPSTEIAAAAKWWASRLRGPVQFDNGATDRANLMARGMASILSVGNPALSDTEIDRFEAALIADLEAGAWRHAIMVDYHPCQILHRAAQAAGIDVEYRLPWKTTMWIRPGRVEVCEGYGAAKAIVYLDPGEPNA